MPVYSTVLQDTSSLSGDGRELELPGGPEATASDKLTAHSVLCLVSYRSISTTALVEGSVAMVRSTGKAGRIVEATVQHAHVSQPAIVAYLNGSMFR